jgi:LytS/YehU family sensor histidine kinase
MTLLTLVENAVRHGIDPAEDGGSIDVRVVLEAGRCRISVEDGGVGLRESGSSLGTGLATLRERLELAFGGGARLQLGAREPHGMLAVVEFPARTATR